MAILAFAVIVYAAGSLFQPTVVVGESMSPTLHSGRLIWIDRTYYLHHRPQRGEVIVFRLDGDTYIKRIYRAPSEKLEYVAAGSDWIEPLREKDYDTCLASQDKNPLTFNSRNSYIKVRETVVPDDSVFVLGDNYEHSVDSRQLGPIPLANVIGRAHLETDRFQTRAWEFTPHLTRPRLHDLPAQSRARAVAPATRPELPSAEGRLASTRQPASAVISLAGMNRVN